MSKENNGLVIYDPISDELFILSKEKVRRYDSFMYDHVYEWKVETINDIFYVDLSISELMKPLWGDEFLGEL